MPDQGERRSVSVNLKLVSTGQSDQPVAVNGTAIQVVQGVAYIDFGFIDPAVLVALTRSAKAGTQPTQDTVEGKLLVRVAMGVDMLRSFRSQLEGVLSELGVSKEEKQ
jgi:hypothetical protein